MCTTTNVFAALVGAALLIAPLGDLRAEETFYAGPLAESDPAGSADGLAQPASGSLGAPQEGLPPDFVRRVEEFMKKSAEKEAAAKQKAAQKPSITVTGRMFADSVLFSQSALSRAAFGDAQDTTFIRQARLGAEGEMFDVYTYKVEMDFAGRDSADEQLTSFKDTYLRIRELPLLGNVQVGHFKEPFSLEQLTSARYVTFMERSLADVFVPARNMGVMAIDHSENERMTWALGAFRTMGDTPPFRADDDGGSALSARITWLPWYDEASDGRGLLHLGVSYSFRDFDDPTQRVRQRPETSVGPRVVDTHNISHLANVNLLGPEVALVYGPFSAQSEWIVAFYNRGGGFGNPTFHGLYAQISYFLTGENRVYKRSTGAFDRVKPHENFFRVCTEDGTLATGRGAWEIAYRYSYLDLNDAGVNGGIASDHTFGLNWYLTPYARLMFNYVHSDADLAQFQDVPLDIFEMRAQFDF